MLVLTLLSNGLQWLSRGIFHLLPLDFSEGSTQVHSFCAGGWKMKILMGQSFISSLRRFTRRWFNSRFCGLSNTRSLCSLFHFPSPASLSTFSTFPADFISSLVTVSPFSGSYFSPLLGPSALAVAEIECDSCHVTSGLCPLSTLPPPSCSSFPSSQSKICLFLCLWLGFVHTMGWLGSY